MEKMYIVITDNRIYRERTLKAVNKKIDSRIEKANFRSIGKDYLLFLTMEDVSFVQDIREIERISLGRFFRPKPWTMADMMSFAIMFMLILVWFRAGK